MGRIRPELAELARLYGVETSYHDVSDTSRHADPDVLLAVLRSIGAPVHRLADVRAACRAKSAEEGDQILPPGIAAWDGRWIPPVIRSGRLRPVRARFIVELEDGSERDASSGKPLRLPYGYHQVRLMNGGRGSAPARHPRQSAFLISAPARAYPLPKRLWGCFIPLYALRSVRNIGAGDLADFGRLRSGLRREGARLIATLPLNAAFLDRPFDPSPYAPVSRLFWNEFYLPLDDIQELKGSPRGRKILESRAWTQACERLRRADRVNYREIYSLKKSVLAELARTLEASDGRRKNDFQRYVSADPLAGEYADFRGTRAGRGERHYHLYVQWLMAARMKKRHGSGTYSYFDLPLGVHPEGFDVHRFSGSFADGISAGAPPDLLFGGGQDWGFSPMHPGRIRGDGFLYFREMIARQLRVADILRIDHVMGLNRIYCIPRGCTAEQGVYVNYPADELYAILTLESRRHEASLVGENLGTVPPEVNRMLDRRGIGRMFVTPFELGNRRGLNPVPKNAVASLNTHDMPTFAGAWNSMDTDGLDRFRKALKLGNRDDAAKALVKTISRLGRSAARIVLLNLEDLWLETEPQNRPGSVSESNWTRKSRVPLEKMLRHPLVRESFAAMRKSR